MIPIGPIQANDKDGQVVMVIGFDPNEGFLTFMEDGSPSWVNMPDLIFDWTYDRTSSDWGPRSLPASDPEALSHAIAALRYISNWDHVPGCPLKDEFDVWDCDCHEDTPALFAASMLKDLESE